MNWPDLTPSDYLQAAWQVAPRVHTLLTTRAGGVSLPPYGRTGVEGPRGGGLNLGTHTGDNPDHVAENRARLQRLTGLAPAWLEQVHGCEVVDAGAVLAASATSAAPAPRADASVSAQANTVCAVMTADCLPVLLCDAAGRAVGAAHAGWRGLAAGVLERAATRVRELAGAGAQMHAFLGPAIGPAAFQVGAEVRAAFLEHCSPSEAPRIAAAFCHRDGVPGKYWADLYALARIALARVGVVEVSGGAWCTLTDAERFYSYRREPVTGRMAALIWLADPA